MLAKRIIPTILCRGRQMVKGERFRSWRVVGHVLQAIRIHQQRSVDEICLLDIAATNENRGPDLKLVKELTEVLFAPLTVGGGIRSLEDVRELLLAGADKVVLNTAAVKDPSLVDRIAREFGNQCVVVAIDVRDNRICSNNGSRKWEHGPVRWAKIMAEHGAGEILLQDVDRDGALWGYNLELIREVSQAVDVPVIASGGCSGPGDMFEAISAGASAVAAGALLQFTDFTPKTCAQYLHERGIEVRL